MKILFLNQTFYPDVAATAQHLDDLCRDLVAAGHEVTVVSSRSIYGSAGAALPKWERVHGVEVHRVGKSLFGKRSLLARLADFFLFYVLAMWKVLRLPRQDVVVPLTTPPMIVLLGVLLKKLRGTRLAYWVMDMYPDVPVAYGVLREGGVAHRVLERLHVAAMNAADVVVVLGQDMRRRVEAKGVPVDRVHVIGPWSDLAELGEADSSEVAALREDWGLQDCFVVMYSGNLGLAHDVETILGAIRAMRDEPRVRFLFVGGGKALTAVMDASQRDGLENIVIQPYQTRERLGVAMRVGDVHLISQSSSMTGLLVPSKLFGIMAAGRAAVFVGDADAEVGRVLGESGCGFVVAIQDVAGLVETLAILRDDVTLREAMGAKGQEAMRRRYDRSHATAAWRELIEKLVQRSSEPVVRTAKV